MNRLKLKKKLSLLSGDVKSGNTNDIITRLESISISIDKSVKELKRNMKESVVEGWKKKKKNEECGLDHDTLKKKKMKKHMDDVHEDEELEEGVSLSKKGNYEVTVDGKSAVGIRIGLRFKGKLIVPGTKQKGLFVMGFNKKDGKHKLPPGATIVKDSGKYVHIGFKKVDDIIAYAVLENITEEVANKTFTEFRNLT